MFASTSKLCCIITGASYGLGQAIALTIAKKSSQSGNAISFVLTARSSTGLEKTKSLISEAYPSAQVHYVCGDISNTEALPTLMDNIVQKVNPKEFSHALFISNAFALGDSSKTLKEHDLTAINSYFSMNMTAPFYLVSRFLNAFSSVDKRYVVNMTSLFSIKEFPGLSLYCTAKAACDMMYRVIAIEEPSVRSLSYEPGPCDTNMLKDLKENSINPVVKKTEGFKPAFSAEKLVHLLDEDEFISGSHIGINDVLEKTRT